MALGIETDECGFCHYSLALYHDNKLDFAKELISLALSIAYNKGEILESGYHVNQYGPNLDVVMTKKDTHSPNAQAKCMDNFANIMRLLEEMSNAGLHEDG